MDIGIATVYATGKQNRILAPLTLVAILNIVLAAMLVPRLGAIGAAVANASAQLVEGFIVLFCATSILASPVPWRNLFVIYSAAVAVALPAFVLSILGAGLAVTSVAIVIGCAAYVMWLTRVGEIAADDWAMIKVAVGRRLGVETA
jgi:O-antigen/teichoic acid export membrane protein